MTKTFTFCFGVSHKVKRRAAFRTAPRDSTAMSGGARRHTRPTAHSKRQPSPREAGEAAWRPARTGTHKEKISEPALTRYHSRHRMQRTSPAAENAGACPLVLRVAVGARCEHKHPLAAPLARGLGPASAAARGAMASVKTNNSREPFGAVFLRSRALPRIMCDCASSSNRSESAIAQCRCAPEPYKLWAMGRAP